MSTNDELAENYKGLLNLGDIIPDAIKTTLGIQEDNEEKTIEIPDEDLSKDNKIQVENDIFSGNKETFANKKETKRTLTEEAFSFTKSGLWEYGLDPRSSVPGGFVFTTLIWWILAIITFTALFNHITFIIARAESVLPGEASILGKYIRYPRYPFQGLSLLKTYNQLAELPRTFNLTGETHMNQGALVEYLFRGGSPSDLNPGNLGPNWWRVIIPIVGFVFTFLGITKKGDKIADKETKAAFIILGIVLQGWFGTIGYSGGKISEIVNSLYPEPGAAASAGAVSSGGIPDPTHRSSIESAHNFLMNNGKDLFGQHPTTFSSVGSFPYQFKKLGFLFVGVICLMFWKIYASQVDVNYWKPSKNDEKETKEAKKVKDIKGYDGWVSFSVVITLLFLINIGFLTKYFINMWGNPQADKIVPPAAVAPSGSSISESASAAYASGRAFTSTQFERGRAALPSWSSTRAATRRQFARGRAATIRQFERGRDQLRRVDVSGPLNEAASISNKIISTVVKYIALFYGFVMSILTMGNTEEYERITEDSPESMTFLNRDDDTPEDFLRRPTRFDGSERERVTRTLQDETGNPLGGVTAPIDTTTSVTSVSGASRTPSVRGGTTRRSGTPPPQTRRSRTPPPGGAGRTRRSGTPPPGGAGRTRRNFKREFIDIMNDHNRKTGRSTDDADKIRLLEEEIVKLEGVYTRLGEVVRNLENIRSSDDVTTQTNKLFQAQEFKDLAERIRKKIQEERGKISGIRRRLNTGSGVGKLVKNRWKNKAASKIQRKYKKKAIKPQAPPAE